MNFIKRLNRAGDKIMFHYDFGRGPGQRPATGLFIYTHPTSPIQKNHNRETLAMLEIKKAQAIVESQAIGTGYIPNHKVKRNFLDYYVEYVENNKRHGNRHLVCCFTKFKKFIKREFLSPTEVTYDFCFRFRRYLLDCLTGETPQNYYATFKNMIKNATRDGYFKINPSEEIAAIRKPSIRLKQFLEVPEYIALLKVPPPPHLLETIEAFIFSLYTGLRWCDVYPIEWPEINANQLTTRIIQAKTGQPVIITLHPIALKILEKQRKRHPDRTEGRVFVLPSAEAANRIIKEWVRGAGIDKEITWSCARLTYSILLQDKNVANATVAYLLGHTTTKQVETTYKRHRPKDQMEAVMNLPSSNNALDEWG